MAHIAITGPHASSSYKKEDEEGEGKARGGGSPLAYRSTMGVGAEEGEGKGRRVAASQPPPRAPPLHAAAGPCASNSYKKEDEVGEGKGRHWPATTLHKS
jgi:hypothetical protein